MSGLLIVGAGPLQLPAYVKAREMGLRVVAVDRNPAAPGMLLADVALALDTRDTEGVVRAVRSEALAGAMTLCTDMPVRTVAAVNEALDLPGLRPDVATRATHKGLMRQAFLEAGAPIPRFFRVSGIHEARAALDEIGSPVIVKPVESSGSQGVCRVNHPDALKAAVDHALAFSHEAGEFLVEEFVDGPEVSVEVVSFGGRHHVLALTDKRTSGAPYFVECGHVEPTRLSPQLQAAVVETTIAGLDALGIMDSAAHVEIRVGPQGPRIIEIGARLGGDYITTELVPRTTGVDMVRAAIDLALGRDPSLTPGRPKAAAVRFLEARPGTVSEIRGMEAAALVEGISLVQVDVRPGDVIRSVRASQDRAGHVIAEGENAAAAENAANAAAALIIIETTTESVP